MITDWSSMFPADSDEYWPELQQAIDHWERRISDDPGMFNQLVWGLMVATHRAEAAEARVKELDTLLDMLPEYLEYWGACDGPALSLSEWWVCKRDGFLE